MQLRLASPLDDPRVVALIDAAFQRTERESRLVQELARSYPAFDRGLCLLAEENGEALGWALFLPREMRLGGAWVKTAIIGPLAVAPAARRRGVGRFLVQAGLAALRDRGMRAAAVIGASEFYGALGFESAFNAYTLRIPVSALSEEGDTQGWRGLDAQHLASMKAIQERNYADVSGSERRFAAPIDWESCVEAAHTLVFVEHGQVEAYLRFRVRSEVEIAECGASTMLGVGAVLRMLRRLSREHRKSLVEAHLPPPHPVARELFQRGAISEANNLAGAGLLRVVDWPGLFQDTRASLEAALSRSSRSRLSLEIDGRTHRLSLGPSGLEIDTHTPQPSEPTGRARTGDPPHIRIPRGWSSGLLTGQRDARDLLFHGVEGSRAPLDREGEELLLRFFPGGTPMWTYSPIFEIADE